MRFLSDLKPKFGTVLLDADETIFDFSKGQEYSLKHTLEEFNLPWSREINDIYSKENLKMWKKFERKEVDKERLKVERFESFFSIIGVSGVDIESVNKTYMGYLSSCGFTVNGALELCEKLHKICKVYIATNGLEKTQKGRLAKSGLAPYIDGLFISDTIGLQKPHKEYFDYIFNTLKISDKSDVIILGDSLTSDMQGGKNAGIATCLFDPKDIVKLPNPLCDYKVNRLEDFINIVVPDYSFE